MTAHPPPDWSLAEARASAHRWANAHVGLRVAGAVLVSALAASLVRGVNGSGAGDTRWLAGLVTGAAIGAAGGIAFGHIAAAGRRYPAHVAASPRLLRASLRPVTRGGSVTALVVAALLGTALPPLAGIAVGVSLVLLVPTGPGVALLTAAARAADVVRAEAGLSGRTRDGSASTLALIGAATVAVAAVRAVTAATVPDCSAGWTGIGCGSGTALAVALGALPTAWLLSPVGSAIARSLDTARRPATDTLTEDDRPTGHVEAPPVQLVPVPTVDESPAAVEAVAPAAVEPDAAIAPDETVEQDEALDELVATIRDGFGALTADTRRDVVTLVSHSLDGESAITVGADVLDTLEAAVRQAGFDDTVAAVTDVSAHVDTIGRLRTQYHRTPKLARGAVEKTAVTAVRTAGVPRDVAGTAVRTLLTMPADDWTLVNRTLTELRSRFATTRA